MTLTEIRNQVMFQTNNDVDDLGDFMPHLNDYVNEGYDQLVNYFTGGHIMDESNDYAPLSSGGDEPMLPQYAHRAIVDYATYLVYRNGNAVKQNRGQAFLSAFLQVCSQLKYERYAGIGMDENGNPTGSSNRLKFKNIYTS